MRWTRTAVVAALAIGSAQQAAAQTVTEYDFDIAAGPRGEVVREIARVAGAAISIADPNAAGLAESVDPVRGKLTLADALKQALAGSDWYVAAAGNGQVRVGRYGENASDIIVTARRQTLRKEDSSLLTRSDTPLKETPGTVVSVSQEVLASQNVTSLEEALRNLPGVTVSQGPPFLLGTRGATTNGESFTSGLRNSEFGGNAPTIDVAAVELLKGPSSILSGTAVAGGLINFVPKVATGSSDNEFSLGVGSNRYIRGSVDIGGTISEENRLYWRFVGLSEYAHEQNGGGTEPSSKVATFILGYRDHGWKIDAQTQYYDNRNVFTRLYRKGDSVNPVIALDEFYKPDAFNRDQSLSQTVSLEKTFLSSENLDLRFRTRARYQHSTNSFTGITCGAPCVGPVNVVIGFSSYSKANQLSSSTDLYAKWRTGPVEQQIIVAFDYARGRRTSLNLDSFAVYPFDPIPDLPSIPTADTPGVRSSISTHKDYGAVIQDQLTWGRFHALISLRKTWFNAEATSTPRVEINEWLPSGGVVFDISKWMSVYYSYQKGITPPSPQLLTFDGQFLPPITTTGHEVGVKLEVLNSRLSINADYFRSSVSNVSRQDPDHPFDFAFVAGPGQKSHGFELSVVGKVTPTLFVQSGFTYTTASSYVPVVSIPKYAVNFWLLKTFKFGESSQIDVGFGGNYQSAVTVFATDPNTGASGYEDLYNDYLRFDAAIGYTRGPVKLNLTVDNVFNRFNLYNSVDASALRRGPGRNVRLVLTLALPGAK
jgi:iron complex outermembrane recepter protein